MKKQFDLGAVLSVSHGVLLCSIGECYKILNFMTADNLYTHQLPRASDECKPWIFRQHPQLEAIDLSDVNRKNWEERLTALKEQYGISLEIEPIPKDDHDVKDPIEELKELAPNKPIIIIEGGTEQ